MNVSKSKKNELNLKQQFEKYGPQVKELIEIAEEFGEFVSNLTTAQIAGALAVLLLLTGGVSCHIHLDLTQKDMPQQSIQPDDPSM